jgi:hypothetical protein
MSIRRKVDVSCPSSRVQAVHFTSSVDGRSRPTKSRYYSDQHTCLEGSLALLEMMVMTMVLSGPLVQTDGGPDARTVCALAAQHRRPHTLRLSSFSTKSALIYHP